MLLLLGSTGVRTELVFARCEASCHAWYRVVDEPQRLNWSRCPRPLWHSRQLTCVIPRNVSNVFAVIWSMMSCVGPIVTTPPTMKFDGPSSYVFVAVAPINSLAIWLYGLPLLSESLI